MNASLDVNHGTHKKSQVVPSTSPVHRSSAPEISLVSGPGALAASITASVAPSPAPLTTAKSLNPALLPVKPELDIRKKKRQSSVFLLANKQGSRSRFILKCSQLYNLRRRWAAILFPILDPRSTGKLIWDSIIMFLVLYSSIIVPIEVGFPDMEFDGGWNVVAITSDVLFCLDLLHHFFVGFHSEDDDSLVTDRRVIAKRYLSSWFLLDFVASMPTEYIATAFSDADTAKDRSVMSFKLTRILRLVRVAKLARLIKVRQFAMKLEDALELDAVFMRLTRLVLQVLLITHVLACFWHMVGYTEDYSSPSWINTLPFGRNSSGARYLYSYYWAVATLAGVGYGDIHATNSDERIYSIMTEIVGASVFGIIIGNITKILDNWNRETNSRVRKLSMVEAFIKRKGLPKDLRIKLTRYFRHYIARTSAFDERALLFEFSLSLRGEILHETYKNTFFTIPAFANLSTQFVIDMAMYIKPLIAVQGEVLAKEHSVGTEMFILNEGIVEVKRTASNGEWIIVLEILTERGIFGESSLLNYTLHQNSYTAKATCDLYTLPKEDFDRLIEEFPEAEHTLLAYHQQRKELYERVFEQTLARYRVYMNSRNNDPVSEMAGIENIYPSLTVLLDGVLRSYRSVPIPILQKMTLEISMGVSVFNSANEKRKMIGILAQEGDNKPLSLQRRLLRPINPDYMPKRVWDVYITILLIYCALAIPFEITFLGTESDDDQTPGRENFEMIIEVSFGLDMLLNFRTGVMNKAGHLVMDNVYIVRAYLKSWFWVDLLSVIPVSTIVSSTMPEQTSSHSFNFIRIVRLFKLARLLKLIRTLIRVQHMAAARHTTSRILRLVMKIVIIAHGLTCGYYYVATTSIDVYNQTLVDIMPETNTVFDKYVYCLYWAVTTMTTVGYGDVAPGNPAMIMYAIIGVLIGASTFTYIVGTLSSLVDEMQMDTDFYRERMDRLKAYLKERQVSKPLAARLRRYYEYYLAQRDDMNEQEIVMSLSDSLRTQLIMHLNRDIVSKMSFFAFCTPGEYVFKEGQVGRHMYFLIKGVAEILFHAQTSEEVVVATLYEGNYFGEIAMLTMSKRAASIRAKTHMSMFVLSRSGLDRMSMHYPEMANNIIQEFRNKIKDIKQTNATRQLGPVVQEDIRAARVRSNLMRGGSVSELQENLQELEAIVTRMVAIFGGDDKGKRKALSCVMQHLRKFEFSLDDFLCAAEEFSSLGEMYPVNRATMDHPHLASIVLATLARSRRRSSFS
ncbi:TPA: hypothetical protein N0F65_011419 [Lagenidium giganteum]|uniref:Cyclic nucleotide-binding domain-containing protein n=1 Tax=Lagenidium giganteum TaxID=4803 RepID=A0AAV2Z9A6_9STRA|nr:TPA: hypothetical protein N0F65_011419 [Lagenidium giganteum]